MPTVGCLTGWNGLNLMRKRKPAEARLKEIQIGSLSPSTGWKPVADAEAG